MRSHGQIAAREPSRAGVCSPPPPHGTMSEPAPIAVDVRHAWTLLARRDPPKRPAAGRIADFLEIYGCYDEATAREQASRCIVCAEPSCVTGCPLASPISEWMALTADGDFRAAADLLRRTSCLPEVSARTCPADKLCEAMCVLDGHAEPVAIWAVEQFLHYYTFDRNPATPPDAPPNGRHVAVIGAGPGGLACADELVRMGCRVTAIDARATSEDALTHGIPAFRIERSLLQRRIENLRQRGVEFCHDRQAGGELALDALRSGYDAIYLGFPARVARTLDVPGARLDGVVQAFPFILAENDVASGPSSGLLRNPGSSLEQALDLERTRKNTQRYRVTGRRVVVIGGGDTALDCARTAVRCGAAAVTCVYRRDEMSLPCSRRAWENAVEEGVGFVFEASPIEVLGTADGAVAGLRLVRTQAGANDDDGRRSFRPQPGTEFTLATDVVFLAIGFDAERFAPDSPLRTLVADGVGRIAVNAGMMTSMDGVFAGGDLVRGPTTPIHSVRDARRAAAGIRDYLARFPAAQVP